MMVDNSTTLQVGKKRKLRLSLNRAKEKEGLEKVVSKANCIENEKSPSYSMGDKLGVMGNNDSDEENLELTQVSNASQQQLIPVANCIVCGLSFGTIMSMQEREIHQNICLDNQASKAFDKSHDVVPKTAEPLIVCPSCGRDLSFYNEHRRSVHVNNCLDTLTKEIQGETFKLIPESSNLLQSDDIQKSNYKCPICSFNLSKSGQQGRLRHLKSCGRKHGISANELVIDRNVISLAFEKTDSVIKNLPGLTSLKTPEIQAVNAFSLLMDNTTFRSSVAPIKQTKNQENKIQTESLAKKLGKKAGFCPMYKKISGTRPPIIVDGFHYACPELSNTYVLTHFHADHYGGLRRDFNFGIIYCTKPTANLVRLDLGVQDKYLHAVPYNRPIVIHGVEMTFMDANHCPGAAIILFKLKNGKTFLHTGDFRFHKKMLDNPFLSKYIANTTADGHSMLLDAVYLDTTYCNPKYVFPPQDLVIEAVLDLMAKLLKVSKTLYLFGSYTIGKENVYMKVAERFNMKVMVEKHKYDILSCLQWPNSTMKLVTREEGCTDFRVVPMNKINFESMTSILVTHRNRYRRIVGFQPTGWTFSPKSGQLITSRRDKSNSLGDDAVVIYGVPYSEHSSFQDLCEFVKTFRPTQIIPTVNCHTAEKSQSQVEILHNSCFNTILNQLGLH